MALWYGEGGHWINHRSDCKLQKRNAKGNATDNRASGKVMTTMYCSRCIVDGIPEPRAHYCYPWKADQTCNAQHIEQAHQGHYY